MKEYKLNIFDALKIAESEMKYEVSSENAIKWVKGNIPIERHLLNKYRSVTEMFIIETANYNAKRSTIIKLKSIGEINIDKLSCQELYHLAVKIFKRYNNENIFINNDDKIIVSNGDIKESVNKIFSNPIQRNQIIEHLQIYANMGALIRNAKLSCQTYETKNRIDNTIWNYYVIWITIRKEKYLLEFDVISRKNGENHYRVQRLQKAVTSAGNTVRNSITPTSEVPAFYK